MLQAGAQWLNALLLRYRLRLLFAASVLLTAVLGWPKPALWLAWGSLLLGLLASLNTLRHKRTLRGLIGLLGLASLALLVLERVLQWHPLFGQGVGMMVFYLAMVASLFNRVIHERPVTGELIYGLLALYLLLALAYAMAYQLINSLQPDAFRSLHGPLQINDFVYYSLVTLTTLGYGDIHALAPAARLLSVSEAVAGVMFIAIAVARSLMLINDRDDSA